MDDKRRRTSVFVENVRISRAGGGGLGDGLDKGVSGDCGREVAGAFCVVGCEGPATGGLGVRSRRGVALIEPTSESGTKRTGSTRRT